MYCPAEAAGLELASTEAKSETSEDSDQVGVLGSAVAGAAVSILTLEEASPVLGCCCGWLSLSQ